MSARIIPCQFGATLESFEYGDTYHSRQNPIAESLETFINPTIHLMRALECTSIRILEVGHGTGLNTVLLLKTLKDLQIRQRINLTGIDTAPLAPSLLREFWGHYPNEEEKLGIGLSQLEYLSQETYEKRKGHFVESQSDSPEQWESQIEVQKVHVSLQDFHDTIPFNVIWFDAFGKSYQPDLWSKEIFTRLANMSNTGALFCTYASNRILRQGLQESGWEVFRQKSNTQSRRERTEARRL